MGWFYESDTPGNNESHEGYMLAQFAKYQVGTPIIAEIPPGHVAGERREDGSQLSYPTGAVIGWRVACDCTFSASQRSPDQWVSKQLWTRVPSPSQHDPANFRIYAPDVYVDDVGIADDVEALARGVWRSEHIDALDAAGAIRAAIVALRSAEEQLEAAVVSARRKRLSWAKIGAAAGISTQAAHERWAKRESAGRSADSVAYRSSDAAVAALEDCPWVVWAITLLDPQRLAGENVAERTAANATAAAELYGCEYEYCNDEDTMPDDTKYYRWYVAVTQTEHRRRVGNVPTVVAELLAGLIGSLPGGVDVDQNWSAGPDLYATQVRNARSAEG